MFCSCNTACLALKAQPCRLQRADGNLARRGWLAEELVGTTPVVDKAVPSGSYLLTIRAPGRVTILSNISIRWGVIQRKVYAPNSRTGARRHGLHPAREISLWMWRGQGDSRSWLGAQPIHPVWTDGYLIARHETTYAEWIEFFEALPDSEAGCILPASHGEKEPSIKPERLAERKYRLTLRPAPADEVVSETGQFMHYPRRDRRREQDWYRFPVSGISREDAEAYIQWLNSSGRLLGRDFALNMSGSEQHEGGRAAISARRSFRA